MHFSINELEETGSYTLYKIHVNGAHHCSIRFSQLNNLYEQLVAQYGVNEMPVFPRKKLLPLSPTEKEERRFQLEKFLQKLSQIPKVLSSDLFTTFFLNAQKETQIEEEKSAELTVYLMNFEKVSFEVDSYDVTENVLIKFMKKINLNTDYLYYFGLYLVKKSNDDSIQIVRKLQDFESPFISLKAANKVEKHRILFRKSLLDGELETDLYNDKIALNLLYIQAISDLEKQYVIPSSKEVLNQLKALQANNSKKQFLQLIKSQKYYGYLHFKECFCDFPKPNSKVLIAIGKRVLNMRFLEENSDKSEVDFRVTRIKCWKIIGGRSENSQSSEMELAFEYLFTKDNLKFVKIKSEQAILISMTLQSIIDEIIMIRDGKEVKKFTEKPKDRNLIPFLTRQKALINAPKTNDQQPYDNSHEVIKTKNQEDLFEDENFISNDDL